MNEITGAFGATYLRISMDKGENEDTLQNHRELMEEFCGENHYTSEVYEEIVSGGKHNLGARPELQKLIDNIERYQAIFTVSLDRLSRNGLVSQQIKQLCIDHEIKIITPSQTFDLAGSLEDRLMYDVSSLFAALEYEMIGRRNKVNKMQRARRGEYVSGRPAYGYRRSRESKKLEIYQPEAEVVRYIFKLYKDGLGSRKIADILNREGFKTRLANAFRPSTIRRILRNPVYKGSVVYQHRKRVKENGEYRYKTLKSIITDHAHPAIIQPDEWEQTRQKQAERRTETMRTYERQAVKTGTTMLKDLLFCGVCGRKLVIRKEKNGVFTIKPCDNLLPGSNTKCYNQGMRLKFLEEEVVLKLQAYKQRLAAQLQLLVQQETDTILMDLHERLALMEKQLQENERLQEKLLDLALTESFSSEKFKMKAHALLEQGQLLEESKKEIMQQIQSIEAVPSIDQLTQMIELFEEFQNLTPEEQNVTLKQFVKRIHYKRVMPAGIRRRSTRNQERQAYPFSFNIEYF
ncbi:recombinase family protein [Paenibacillus jiagnxiensis]|uniref:recombinase family protein n=1 Tax=Paenibacillus jiagnxiensis TaxID=3228926 RepID=UPI0033BA7E98